MSQRPFEPGDGMNVSGPGEILSRIREDMEVYDIDGDHVGEVEFVYMGSASPTAAEFGHGPATADEVNLRDDSIIDIIARAFAGDEMPDVIQKRLLYNGFIKVEGEGLFAPDRYVMPDQIASVVGERVNLKVHRRDLVKE